MLRVPRFECADARLGGGALITFPVSGPCALDRALDRSSRINGDEVLAIFGRGDQVGECGDPVSSLRRGRGDCLRVAFRAGERALRLGRAVCRGGRSGDPESGALDAAVGLDRDDRGDSRDCETRRGNFAYALPVRAGWAGKRISTRISFAARAVSKVPLK